MKSILILLALFVSVSTFAQSDYSLVYDAEAKDLMQANYSGTEKFDGFVSQVVIYMPAVLAFEVLRFSSAMVYEPGSCLKEPYAKLKRGELNLSNATQKIACVQLVMNHWMNFSGVMTCADPSIKYVCYLRP